MTGAALYLIAGVLISLPCCILVPRLLARSGLLDMPGVRSSHVRPTPKGGGVGIVAAFVWAGIAGGLTASVWLPLLALAVLSFFNDLRPVAPKARLVAQFVAAAVALWGTWWGGLLDWNGFLLLPAILFVIATANCYNFMDGINGIAGISGIIAFSCLIAFAAKGEASVAFQLPSLAVIGGLVGFLPFNFPKARVFMGDAGSVFLGFVFALFVCFLARSWTEFFVLASFLYPFYADEAVTMVERIWRGESLLQPHRRHLYQFFANELAFAHWKVSAAFGLLQFSIAMLAIMAGKSGLPAVLGLDASLLALWAFTHWIIKRRFQPIHGGR